ncbi:MAG: NAD-dependent DNA ligase LigA [Kiritimatiellae bacterium]|nr:NAD-dependent DNA ligase LigA [Kiritimatiellia bacterium]
MSTEKDNSLLERLAYLRGEINRHDYLYYVEARPEIGDADYDKLYREMLEIEAAHPDWVTPDSPSQRVSGAPIDGFKQVRHDPPMRSLDKTHSKEELLEFDTFLRKQLPDTAWDYVVEPKVDGVSLSLLYLDGKLTRAATRGNGEIGDDITVNMKTIRSIPLSIPDAPAVLEVRGECYMTKAGFLELNRREEEAGREPFANPRNAAAGSMKLLDPKEVAKRPLDVVIYASGKISGESFTTHTEMIEQFRRWGFKTSPWQRLCVDIDAAIQAIDELEQLRHTFPFEIDGAVLKLNRRALYSQLGMTAHAPRWARAYKYAPERAETQIRSITVQVGRTGVLTPVAELVPVPLAGSEIARATLHNAEDIARRDIREGDHVWIVKAGDVIPAIDSVITEKRTGAEKVFQMPSLCPECGAEVAQLPGEVAIRCTNPSCPAQQICRLEHFCERNALDIKAIGEKVAEALVSQGIVEDILDLFSLSEETLSSLVIGDAESGLRRFGKNGVTAFQAIQAAKERPLHNWLYAIGIPNIGVTVAEQVAAIHADFAELASLRIVEQTTRLASLYAQASELKPRSKSHSSSDDEDGENRKAQFVHCCGEIGVIGDSLVESQAATKVPNTVLPPVYTCVIKPETAKSLTKFFTSEYGKKFVARMAELGINPKRIVKQAAANGVLAGLSFVLTGTLSQPRSVVAEQIKAAGGIVQDAVSSKTDYLVAGANVGASKTAKAQKLGTKVIGETDLVSMLAGSVASVSMPQSESETAPSAPKGKPPVEEEEPERGYIQGELPL